MDIIYELLKKEEKSLVERLEAVREQLKTYESGSLSEQLLKATLVQKQPSKNEFVEAVDVKKYSAPQKMLFALKENNRFMKIREIAEYISNITDEDVDNLVTQLSRRTKYLKEKGKIVKHQHGNKRANSFWGSPKWLDSDGNIKNENKYILPKTNQIDLMDI